MARDEPTRASSDREAIKELRAAYGYHLDNHEWDEFRALFTEDAVLDYGENIGHQEGAAGLEFFTEYVDERVEAGTHMMHSPIIEVDGETATGRWYVDARESFPDGKAGITTGEYHDTYRRVDGTWKFAEVEFTVHYQIIFDGDNEIETLRRRPPVE